MVGAVVNTGVVDTLEARLENARRRHKVNEYGDLPWAVVEAGIRAVWATEHPPWLVSPRPVNTEGGVDAVVNAVGGQVGSSAGGTSRQRGVIHANKDDAAAGDDAIPAADQEEAGLLAGTGMGLHGKLKLKARWSLHLGVSEETKGWELLDIADNRVVTTSDVVFYENMSLEVWKSEHGPTSGRTPTTPPTDTSTATLPMLVEVGEPAAEDVKDVPSPSPYSSPAPPVPPLVADLRLLTPASASGDEGSSGASSKVPTKSIAGGRRDVQQVDMRVMWTPAG
ncbi:unnamed protein product [Closterium sp. NIES-54]